MINQQDSRWAYKLKHSSHYPLHLMKRFSSWLSSFDSNLYNLFFTYIIVLIRITNSLYVPNEGLGVYPNLGLLHLSHIKNITMTFIVVGFIDFRYYILNDLTSSKRSGCSNKIMVLVTENRILNDRKYFLDCSPVLLFCGYIFFKDAFHIHSSNLNTLLCN